MNFFSWLACFIFLLPPMVHSTSAATSEESAVTGHARIEIESADDDTFSAKCTADFIVKGVACGEQACQTASVKAAEKLAALFSQKAELKEIHVEPLPQCECSGNAQAAWSASCDQLKGLARHLCYVGPH